MPSMACPAPPPGGLSCGPPRSGESSRWIGPRGVADRARGKGPCPHAGADKQGVGRGQTGRTSTTGRHRPPPTATRVESFPIFPLCVGHLPPECPPPRRLSHPGAEAMASSRSSAVAPTEEMASPRTRRATPAPRGTPASATAKSGSPAVGSSRVSGAPESTGAVLGTCGASCHPPEHILRQREPVVSVLQGLVHARPTWMRSQGGGLLRSYYVLDSGLGDQCLLGPLVVSATAQQPVCVLVEARGRRAVKYLLDPLKDFVCRLLLD